MQAKKCLCHLLYAEIISCFTTRKCQKTWLTLVNIEVENLRIFWTSWGISMKFSGMMWLMIILKVNKSRTLSFLWKTWNWKNYRRGRQTDWFPVKRLCCQQDSRSAFHDWISFCIFFRKDITAPSFIILGYARQVLGRRELFTSSPSVNSSEKAHPV